MNTQPIINKTLGRRAFVRGGTLFIAASAFAYRPTARAAESPPPALRIGLLTDLHYADKPSAGTRHYRETPAKLAEAAERYAASPPAFVVELGDFIDAADAVDVELSYLATINRQFAAMCQQRYYVLGNHCVDTLRKEEFLDAVEQPRSYYSFDRSGFHFIVLDACFRADGQPYGRKNSRWDDSNVSAEELEWLAADLKSNHKPCVVFAHQRLDVSNQHGIKNARQVRELLEASGKILAVFQGHSHQNDLNEINGIPYCTLVAMVEGTGAENNAFGLLEIDATGNLQLQGFRRQADYHWMPGV